MMVTFLLLFRWGQKLTEEQILREKLNLLDLSRIPLTSPSPMNGRRLVMTMAGMAVMAGITVAAVPGTTTAPVPAVAPPVAPPTTAPPPVLTV